MQGSMYSRVQSIAVKEPSRVSSGLLLLLLLFVAAELRAQETPCRECPVPAPDGRRDTVMDVRLRDGRTLRNVVSARRVLMRSFGEERQGLRFRWFENDDCRDTTLQVEEAVSFSIGGLGIGGQTLVVPVRPARELYREQGSISPSTNFLEISALLGYGGADESEQEIGFDPFYFGAEVLVAPFGDLLGEHLAAAIGGGVMIEPGRYRVDDEPVIDPIEVPATEGVLRLRFPLIAHLRYTLAGSPKVVEAERLVPSPCQFGREGDAPATLPDDDDIEEVPSALRTDSTVYYLREKEIVEGSFRPYVFIEGGIYFDGDYEGAGADPSVNPDDHGQYLAGLGLGLPIGPLSISLGYRYNRLNLRTPCPACEEKMVVNTNVVHSGLLKIGWLVGW